MTAAPAVNVIAAEGSATARPRQGAIAALARNPVAVICAGYLFLLPVALVAAPLLARYSPNAEDLTHVLADPSVRHWLGTDQLGRDVTSRLLYGGRSSLIDVLVTTGTFLLAGVPLGFLAGYLGGPVDRIVSRVTNLLFALPAIVILLMVVAIFPNGDPVAMITLGIIASPGLLRVIRGTTLALRQELFVRAAQLSGLRTAAVLRRHVLPSLADPIIVQGSLFCAGALIAESGLSFLGLLRPDSTGPTWGNMVADAANVLGQDTWLLVPTGGIIALTVLAFSLLGDAIRDATVGRSIGSVPLIRQLTTPAASAPSSPRGDGLLVIDGITVTLGDVRLLTEVSLTVRAGEAVGIVGERGCGKTVTARAVLGMALVLVTHDWGVLAEVCDRAVVMYAGEIVEEATVESLCLAPRHPYSAALLAANPQLAAPGQPLRVIPGRVPAPSAWPAGCRFAPRCSRATPECTAQPIQLGAGVRCVHPVTAEVNA
jgi:peptide/nickel transport system permease protein